MPIQFFGSGETTLHAHWIWGWMDPTARLDALEKKKKFLLYWNSNTDRQPAAWSLYRLGYTSCLCSFLLDPNLLLRILFLLWFSRRLVAGLSPRKPRFSPKLAQVRFAVEEVQRDRFFSNCFDFSLSASFNRYPTLIHSRVTDAKLSQQLTASLNDTHKRNSFALYIANLAKDSCRSRPLPVKLLQSTAAHLGDML
jgi:hypothetical protein